MAEQYTETFDLFKVPGAIKSPLTRGPNKDFQLQLMRFSDGRVQIQGQAYVDSSLPGFPIANNQVLIDLQNTGNERLNQIFAGGAANYQEGFILMGAIDLSGNTGLVQLAIYRRSSSKITYNTSTWGAVVTGNLDYTFQGTIWPNDVKPTSSLLWGV